MNESISSGSIAGTAMNYNNVLSEPQGLMDVAPAGDTIRHINIEPLNSGYVVRVGCQTVAIETTEKLVEVLTKYLNNPSQVEKEWFSKPSRNRLENIS